MTTRKKFTLTMTVVGAATVFAALVASASLTQALLWMPETIII